MWEHLAKFTQQIAGAAAVWMTAQIPRSKSYITLILLRARADQVGSVSSTSPLTSPLQNPSGDLGLSSS
ncbi:hypothetical protein OMCYN_01792 [cyanobiont of Ornithocercus magnificus]|nr:hypothetical protein OMCYN_01792 [cyanobiont of Ornithocercus magnificus]